MDRPGAKSQRSGMKGSAVTTAAEVRRRLAATDEADPSPSTDHSTEPDPRLVALDDRYDRTREVLGTSWRVTRPRKEVEDLSRAFSAAWVTLRARLASEKTPPVA